MQRENTSNFLFSKLLSQTTLLLHFWRSQPKSSVFTISFLPNFFFYYSVTVHKILIPGREFILRTCDVGTVWHLTPRKISPS